MVILEWRRGREVGFNWKVSPQVEGMVLQTPWLPPQDATCAQAKVELVIYRAPSGYRCAPAGSPEHKLN